MGTKLQELRDIVLKQGLLAGDAGLHMLDKDNFELYLIALEVRDEDSPSDPIKELLLFPVNPDSLMYIQKTLTNIKKSFTGVHVNDNSTFVPSPINLSGTFGRKLRTIVGKNLEIATGFGATKKLYNLIKVSKSKNSNNKPYRTLFYCLPFSEIFTVEINECRFTQTMEKNRMWNYDLNMTAVAPGIIGSLNSYKVFDLLSMNSLSKFINDAHRVTKDIIWD